MGDWHTVHLFNDKIFYNEIVPLLKGDKGDLFPYYLQFLTTCLGGKSEISMEEMISVSNQLENDFRIFPPFQKYLNNVTSFYSEYKWSFQFSRFFEYVVFTDCADYWPYFISGRTGIEHLLPDMPLSSAGHRALGILGEMNYSTVFSAEGMGITGWISSEDVKVLLSDIENSLQSVPQDDMEVLEYFMNFLRIAAKLDLGMISGVNVDDGTLRTLPQYKLSDELLWKNERTERLGFV